ncbi:unnamed protein product [Arabidopsis lyrata]|uniref:Cyclin-dependent protein kinase inhibitor SMR6 n=1 Tax=Arabidopsis lyrata subsp. lyrata TaxID=81972 RepID=D7LPI7_ARALL|nr:cyclin-dependent protein kinase inhibitor SMR7 [Arabidopsis lyrata subsp. lyrata]EFH53324.1 hypothetical protein ARALYDRAFT_905014 [Arabidopsis lyrata subsp. lyrata]CAH8266964.1 unnamed protein product [Arabidopsis lyrata]|eukprot:XP_002877065.1 cyclin-dependent protein kinase inhibitor SMR7 [Arabidopsis lyrata subsp. lyrata]
MGISKKSQVSRGFDTEGKKFVFATVSIRASLKPVKTKLKRPERESKAEEDDDICITPTGRGAEAPEKLKCPAAPRKRQPALKCRSNIGIEFFVPPSDLESVFIQRR